MMFFSLMIGTFVVMEAVAYFAHKYLFHGCLWFLHRSHHEPRRGTFEWNDVFGPFFAVIAIILIGGYAAPDLLRITRPIGAGMTLYGAVYFFIHDMYTHRRMWRFDIPLKWFASMRAAHRHHHSSVHKEGQEPFGFIYFANYKSKSSSATAAMALLMGLVTLASFALTGCASIAEQIIKEPKVNLSRVNVKDVTAQGATVLFGVEVDNPNAFALKVDSLRYDIEIGGKALTSGRIEQAAEVQANAKSIVDIPVPVKFSEIFSSVMDLVSSGSKPFRVRGEAKFGLFTLPFDKTGEIKFKQ